MLPSHCQRMDLRLDIDTFMPILADQINGQPMIYALSASPWMLVMGRWGLNPTPTPTVAPLAH